MDRGAWWATVRGITKSQTRLSNYTFTLLSYIHVSAFGNAALANGYHGRADGNQSISKKKKERKAEDI